METETDNKNVPSWVYCQVLFISVARFTRNPAIERKRVLMRGI